MFDLDKKLAELAQAAIMQGPKILLALITLIIGLWVVKILIGFMRKSMSMREFDPTIQRFLVSLVDVVLKVMLILSVASTLGFETTSFLAILTSASLAVGLALQGGLSNFAGGVLILIFKPFKVGDKINAQGFLGDVTEISIFVTKLMTADKKTIIIPNGPLANGSITNLSANGTLRMDLNVNVNGNQDLGKAREVIVKALLSTKGVLAEPAPVVGVAQLGDGWTKLVVMLHCDSGQFDDVFILAQENMRNAMNMAGIEQPIPHQIQISK